MPFEHPDSQFYFNPFVGFFTQELDKIIVPRFDLDYMMKLIQTPEVNHIEFLGKQGRGKTTHLRWLASHLPQYPLFLLSAESDLEELYADDSSIIFVDSIHHIPIYRRVALFKKKKSIIFTTHWTRKLECAMAAKALHTIRFKGIDTEYLYKIINNRLQFASTSAITAEQYFEKKELEALIAKFGDDYRGILNHLFDNFQL